MKCQNCGRDNAPGAEQCSVCQLPLDVDVKHSPVGGVSSTTSSRPVRSIFLASGIILLAGTAYVTEFEQEPRDFSGPEGDRPLKS